jgi:hypothetical protein
MKVDFKKEGDKKREQQYMKKDKNRGEQGRGNK